MDVLLSRRWVVYFGGIFFVGLTVVNIVSIVNNQLKEDMGLMLTVLGIYLVFLAFNSVNAWVLMCGTRRPGWSEISMWVGNVCFFLCDNMVGKNQLNKWSIFDNYTLHYAIVMVSYYLAQFLMFNAGINLLTNKTQKEGLLKQSMVSDSTIALR